MKDLIYVFAILMMLTLASCAGPQGEQGDTGATGAAGAQGSPGLQGPTGVVPTPTPIPAPMYMGCYTDNGTRALPNFLMTTGATLETCVALARAGGFAYAGLQYGVQCFAGNVVGFEPDVANACDMPCVANPNETCGGTWHNSIYFTGIIPQ
jgi:WSC domain